MRRDGGDIMPVIPASDPAAIKSYALALLDEKRRRVAQRDLYAYAARIFPEPMARHDRLFARVLGRWLDGTVPRLMIMAPPRHKKSYWGSWAVPTYLLGSSPRARIMHLTHTQAFADKMGRRNRNTLNSSQWPWPEICVSDDNAARARWSTTPGGEYLAFGMDGSPTGHAADYLIIDDPLKGHKEADSPTVRDKQWQIYQSDLTTRLEGAPPRVLIIMTRWHEDDIPGRILGPGFEGAPGWYRDQQTGEPWFVCSLPAQAEHPSDLLGREPGEWLWPEVRGEERLGPVRARGGRTWSSLFQQRPAPGEGLLIQSDWIRWYTPEQRPALGTMAVYMASDYAVTEDGSSADPDYTVHIVCGVDPRGAVYVLDIWRERAHSGVSVDAEIDMAEQYRPLISAQEKGVIDKAIGPWRREKSRARQVLYATRTFTSSVNKSARAQSLIGLMSEGRLYLPRANRHSAEVERELLQFPVGRHDDAVDALSLFARLLSSLSRGTPAEAVARGSISEAWREHDAMSAARKGGDA